jgi:hypothetical protein
MQGVFLIGDFIFHVLAHPETGTIVNRNLGSFYSIQ